VVLWKAVAAATLCALVLVAAASGGAHARTVSLKITVYGAGVVKVGGRPSIKCASICHRSLPIRIGSRVTLVAKPGKLGKRGPWEGVCKGSASRCRLRVTRKERVAARFVAPGTKTNPIPMQTRWPIGDGWTLKVVGVTPNSDGQVIGNASGLPAVPDSGTQFFMLDVVVGYPTTGSGMLGPMAQNWSAEGRHGFKYEYFDDTHCGAAADVSLPAPDLQPLLVNNELVSSGQSVEGHICFQVATNDASTLLFNTAPHRHSGLYDFWFSLHS
jgi:hypothetical protein